MIFGNSIIWVHFLLTITSASTDIPATSTEGKKRQPEDSAWQGRAAVEAPDEQKSSLRRNEGEIDLVSLSSDGIFHFIEVKTRSSLAFGHPFEAINRDKAHRMQRLALAWLATHGCLGCEYAIDVVAILIAADGQHSLEYRGAIL
jgi:putative endonuclease